MGGRGTAWAVGPRGIARRFAPVSAALAASAALAGCQLLPFFEAKPADYCTEEGRTEQVPCGQLSVAEALPE
jgi:hypothetical protein